jgi:hypothetical protein
MCDNTEYFINTMYGILLPASSTWYDKVVKNLKHLYPDVAENFTIRYCDDDDNSFEEYNFLDHLEYEKLEYITPLQDVHNLAIHNVTDDYYNFTDEDGLILYGNHLEPTLLQHPFNSVDEAVDYYKTAFKHILPDNFDYKQFLGRIEFLRYS